MKLFKKKEIKIRIKSAKNIVLNEKLTNFERTSIKSNEIGLFRLYSKVVKWIYIEALRLQNIAFKRP